MKRLWLGGGSTLIFLGLFFYFYKNTRQFRKSVISAFVGLTIYFSFLPPAHSIGSAEGFLPQPQHNSRPSKGLNRSGLFSGRSSNSGSGPGKPGGGNGGDDGSDSGIPQCPKLESVEETQARIAEMDFYIRRMEKVSDSDTERESEIETDQCDQQNKAGINELPDSCKFIYNLEIKTAKKAVKKVWKNPQARKEIISNLNKIDRGELLPRNEKDFKGFKTLKELKFTKTRMLIRPGKNGKPDEIIAIFLRRDLEGIAKKLKNKFD